MKLYIEDDNGNRINVKEIEKTEGSDILFFFIHVSMTRDTDIEALEKQLTEKTNRKCVVLSGIYDRVLGIAPL